MMWCAFFLALGITLVLLGLELFFVEQLEVKRLRRPANQNAAQTQFNSAFQTASYQQPAGAATPTVTINRKEWMPWSLLAVGAIVVIYTYTIPQRGSAES